MHPVTYALRRLRASPAFTVAAITTLGVAIGATASVFGLVDGVLLKALPYREPDRILVVRSGASAAEFLDWSAASRSFSALAASSDDRQVTVNELTAPEHAYARQVTPTYFRVLGITPYLGRTLTADSTGPSEVVIGYSYWRARLGAASSVIGEQITIDSQPATIVGVMPPGLPDHVDLWTRLSFKASDLADRKARDYFVYGRLVPGIAAGAAVQDLMRVTPRPDEHAPIVSGLASEDLALRVGRFRPALLMLLAAAGCVLLIGAANLANLFLVRCLARQPEIAIRTALGATRRRIMLDLVTEAALLGVVATALGIALADAGVGAMRAFAPAFPRLGEVTLDGRLVAFCVLIAMVTVCIFGAFPAWRVLNKGRHRVQDALVVLQMALGLALLTGAGLLVQSFGYLMRQPIGFDREHILTAQIALPIGRYPTPERQAAFMASVAERLGASVSSFMPGSNELFARPFTVVGESEQPAFTPAFTSFIAVTPNYFSTMRIAVVRGRGFGAADHAGSPKVAVADQGLAQRFFPGRDAVGQRLALGGDTVEIVGIAASARQHGLGHASPPELYVPLAQFPSNFAAVELRGTSTPAAALRRALASLDPTVVISDVRTMNARLADSVSIDRFSSFLALLFSAVALILGSVGIYSVLAYVVAQRRREIAIRMALGAQPTALVGDIVGRALRLASMGIGLGSLLAWWLTHAIAGLFVGIGPHDLATFVGAAAVFAIMALAAASVPAFRTTRVDPATALIAC
jgi:putative ABC transport system permease protein